VNVVCADCEAEPRPGAAAGDPCATCGTPLIAVAPPEDLTGKVIDGRFEIVSRLGKGGMGTVYVAKQRSLGRQVALKLIQRHLERETATVKRFLREAQLASSLSHPNVVGVIEFGQDPEGYLYIAMELVRGETLSRTLRRGGAMPVARAATIGAQICDALDAAHAAGIVHRDLKLDNVMLVDAGDGRDHVKVLDFGLAKALDDDSTRATAVGTFAGSPQYMPPEIVLEGAASSPAQDMYAVGVMLAELVQGHSPWSTTKIEQLFAQKAVGKADLSGIGGDLRVLIDELLGAPGRRPSPGETRRRLRAMADLPPSAFAPKQEASPALELEERWAVEKAAKLELATMADDRRTGGTKKIVASLLALVVVAAGIGVVLYVKRDKGVPTYERGEVPATPNTITIEIRAKPPMAIRIDNNRAGKTPLTLHVPKRGQQVMIEALLPGHDPQFKQITADHDQTVDFQ
jgi:serine/threonine protein kinase